MKKTLISLFAFTVITFNAHATYPTIDVKNIAQVIANLQELQAQTGILDQQTQVMLEDLSVQWATYDNALDMYASLGDAASLVSEISNFSGYLTALDDSLNRWKIDNVLDQGIMGNTLDRFLGGSNNINTDSLVANLKQESSGHTRTNWLMGAMNQNDTPYVLEEMTESEVSKVMVDTAWSNQALVASESAVTRQANAVHKERMSNIIADDSSTVMGGVERTKDVIAYQTQIQIENEDMTQQFLNAQTESINVNNDILEREYRNEVNRNVMSRVLYGR